MQVKLSYKLLVNIVTGPQGSFTACLCASFCCFHRQCLPQCICIGKAIGQYVGLHSSSPSVGLLGYDLTFSLSQITPQRPRWKGGEGDREKKRGRGEWSQSKGKKEPYILVY